MALSASSTLSADDVTANTLFDLFVTQPSSNDMRTSYAKPQQALDVLERSGLSQNLTNALFARVTRAWIESTDMRPNHTSLTVAVEHDVPEISKGRPEKDDQHEVERPKNIKSHIVQPEAAKVALDDEEAAFNQGETEAEQYEGELDSVKAELAAAKAESAILQDATTTKQAGDLEQECDAV